MDRLAELTQGIVASNLMRCHDCNAACWERSVWLYFVPRDNDGPPCVIPICEKCSPREEDGQQ